MKPFYRVDIDESDALSVLPLAGAPDPIPEEFERFKLRCEQTVNRVRRQVPKGPERTELVIDALLRIARLGLQDGKLEDVNVQLNFYDNTNYRAQYYDVRLEQDKLGLTLLPWIPLPMPKEATTFMNRIDRTSDKVRRLIEPKSEEEKSWISRTLVQVRRRIGLASKPEDEIKKRKLNFYLDELRGLAFLGLQKGDIAAAASALDGFENRFVQNEGALIRNKYIVTTLKITSVIFVIELSFLAYNSVSSKSISIFFERFQLDANFLPTLLSVVIGICLGMSFFALVRAPNPTFDSMEHFDPDDLQSWLRFLLVSIVALITCILLSDGVLKIGVAKLKLEEFADHRLTAVILGIMCGYSDAAITRALTGVLGPKS